MVFLVAARDLPQDAIPATKSDWTTTEDHQTH